MSLIATVFYFGTVGVLARNTDAKLRSVSTRLAAHFQDRGIEALRQEIEQLLADGIEQDTEVYLLVGADGRKLAGWSLGAGDADRLQDRSVIRDGRPSVSRTLPLLLSDGATLVV